MEMIRAFVIALLTGTARRGKGSSMKSTDDLPDDEGTMFIAWSVLVNRANVQLAVAAPMSGHREVRVGRASMSTLKGVKHSIEHLNSTGVDVELVIGAEADKLFTHRLASTRAPFSETRQSVPKSSCSPGAAFPGSAITRCPIFSVWFSFLFVL